MMPEVHNLPPDNGAHGDPARWENNDAQDKRGIRKVWETAGRLVDRAVEDAVNAVSEAASGLEKRMKDRKVEPGESKDTRGFPAYEE